MANFGCEAYQRNFRTTSSTTKIMYPFLNQYDRLSRIRTSVSKEQKKCPIGESALMRSSSDYRRGALLIHEALTASSIVV